MTTSITTVVLCGETVKLFGCLTVCPFTMTGPFSSRKIPISLIDSVVVWGGLPNLSSVEHPSIAHLPRPALGFFVFRHFGFQVASASTRRSLP